MKITLQAIAFLYAFSPQITLADDKLGYPVLEQHENVASGERASAWKAECESKKIMYSCYNYAVHLAQTEGDELSSVKYYRQGCDLGYDVSCFNLAGVLIKTVDTRAEGVRYFRQSCKASQSKGSSELKVKTLKIACDIVPTVEKNMTSEYASFAYLLKPAHPPQLKQNSKESEKIVFGKDNNHRKQMNQALDQRLLSLKKTDSKQFKIEMDLQKDFNSAIDRYCQFFQSKCEGSVCGMCIDSCYTGFYIYRKDQALAIDGSKYELSDTKSKSDKSEKYFKIFAKNFCALPLSVWKGAQSPQDCESLVLKDLQERVISNFIRNEKNEGEVCAQLED